VLELAECVRTMADIHVREITNFTNGRGQVDLIFHLPIDSPITAVVPTQVSSIASELNQSEIDALSAGTLVEVHRDIVVFKTQDISEIIAKVKTMWQLAYAGYNTEYGIRYKYYGSELNVP
jgi:hypothetical protein